MTGTLYLVATPIGNLDDLSTRAAQVLCEVDLIASEDTRRTGVLLKRVGSRVPQISYHDHNAARRVPGIVERLQAGESIAVVSDAGTPTVSDPGFRLVRAAREAGLPVVPIPGPSAVLAALSGAGLPTDRFVFLGFLPPRPGRARKLLDGAAQLPMTLILFVSPHKVPATLAMLVDRLGDRDACLCRELTKLHETFDRGTLGELSDRYGTGKVRGEITLVVAGTSR